MKAYLEPEEIAQTEERASNLRDKLLIRALFHLGCRVTEAPGLDLPPENDTRYNIVKRGR
jgi:integrase/recombinase XerD